METKGSEIEKTLHWFLDEAGDTSFYGKGKKPIIGSDGVSKSFIIGIVHFQQPLEWIRNAIAELHHYVLSTPYFDVVSIRKKKDTHGYYFHATDDLPEVRKLVYDFIKKLDCSFEAIVGRKSVTRYEMAHEGKEQHFYADMLSYLLKNKLDINQKLVLHVAERGKSTKNANLELALEKAKQGFAQTKNHETIKEALLTKQEKTELLSPNDIITNIVFNVTKPVQEPLLTIADYLCWAIQNVFEKGETRYYNYIREKISVVTDIYGGQNRPIQSNIYTQENLLTPENKISPPLH